MNIKTKNIVKLLLTIPMAALLLIGCETETEKEKVAVEPQAVIIPKSSSEQSVTSSSFNNIESNSISSSTNAVVSSSVPTTSNIPSEQITDNSSNESLNNNYDNDSVQSKPKETPKKQSNKSEYGSTMYVNRQKYGKKEPYPNAERSRFYDINQQVRVVSKTNTGYFKLDNGDYILCEYLSETNNILNIVPETVKGDIPDSPLENIGKKCAYDPNAALEYARSRWNKDESLCAEFGSECLTAGGVSFDLASSTSLYNSLVASNMGYAVEIDLNDDGTANLPDYVFPGDMIFYYCAEENMMVHTAIYNGDTKDGFMKAYAHNPNNNGEDKFVYFEKCTGGCGYPLNKIVVFCFYRNPAIIRQPQNSPNILTVTDKNVVDLNWKTDFLYRSSEVIVTDAAGKEVYRKSMGTDQKCQITFDLTGEYTAVVEFKISDNITAKSNSAKFFVRAASSSESSPS